MPYECRTGRLTQTGEGKGVAGLLSLQKHDRAKFWLQSHDVSRIIRSYLSPGTDPSSCICKAEFCYVCAKTWKNCTCPLFNYREELPNNVMTLHRRAERAVERHAKHLGQTWGGARSTFTGRANSRSARCSRERMRPWLLASRSEDKDSTRALQALQVCWPSLHLSMPLLSAHLLLRLPHGRAS